MRLAAILGAVAGSIARGAGDPRMKPRIAGEMAKVFGPELKAALAGAGTDAHIAGQVDLAGELAGNDAVIAYMKGRRPLMDAAMSIVTTAERLHRNPLDLLDLLQRQLEIDLATFDKDQIQAGVLDKDQEGGGDFPLGDLTGEISADLFYGMFQGGTPTWSKGRPVFAPTARKKLDDLAAAVAAPDRTRGVVSTSEIAAQKRKRGNMSDAQARHFELLERDEGSQKTDYENSKQTPEQYVAARFKTRYGLDDHGAKTLCQQVVDRLKRVPMTITFNPDTLWGKQSTGDDPTFGHAYKSEPALIQKDFALDELLLVDKAKKPGADQKIRGAALPHGDVMAIRGRNYVRWRVEKDEAETGYHSLSAEDLPVFGALNPSWEKTRGGALGGATVSTETIAGGQYKTAPYGENYYGKNHLVLKEHCRPRAVFDARPAAQVRKIERTTVELVLADLVRHFMWEFVDPLVNAQQNIDQIVLHGLNLEVHVFGGVDLRHDVKEIHLQADLFREDFRNDSPAGRIKRFAATNGITVHNLGSAATDYKAFKRWQAPVPTTPSLVGSTV
jgi:hypothetical protein